MVKEAIFHINVQIERIFDLKEDESSDYSSERRQEAMLEENKHFCGLHGN